MLKKNFIVKDKKRMSMLMSKLRGIGLIEGQHFGGADTISKSYVVSEHAKFWIAMDKMHHPLVRRFLLDNNLS